MRAKIGVSHLRFSAASKQDEASSLPLVSENSGTPGLRDFLAIVTSELSSMATAVFVLAAYHSAWGLLWMSPLAVRLSSAVCAVPRDPLRQPVKERDACFEVHTSQSTGNFVLLTGPESLVRQFFEHYGHPQRHRFREIVQLCTLALFILLFPMQLLVSTIFTPQQQYVWLSYRLYAVVAALVSRYSYFGLANAPHRIARVLADQWPVKNAACAMMEASLLFSHGRDDESILRVDVTISYHSRYLLARAAKEELLSQLVGYPGKKSR